MSEVDPQNPLRPLFFRSGGQKTRLFSGFLDPKAPLFDPHLAKSPRQSFIFAHFRALLFGHIARLSADRPFTPWPNSSLTQWPAGSMPQSCLPLSPRSCIPASRMPEHQRAAFIPHDAILHRRGRHADFDDGWPIAPVAGEGGGTRSGASVPLRGGRLSWESQQVRRRECRGRLGSCAQPLSGRRRRD